MVSRYMMWSKGNILLFLTFLLQSILATLTTDDVKYRTEYYEADIDHFDFVSNKTFKLRYLINDTYWHAKSGAPIFFYTGNEGDIVTFAKNTGIMWELAPEFDALILFGEHRYYGESLPFGNLSLTDPKYSGFLSSSQALADYVSLLDHVKRSHGLPLGHNPVIAFGGSYGGMLAAWIRMKYPGAIAGSLAASAPIWQFTGMTPCYAFNRVTTSVYKSTSLQCYEYIKQSWSRFDKLSTTNEGIDWIKETFKVCQNIKAKDDVEKLKNWVNDNWINMAMGNYPYPADFVSTLPGHPIKVACSRMNDSAKSDKEILTNVFKGISVYFNYTGKTNCLNLSSEFDTGIDSSGWDLQSCTEMVMPMCSDGPEDMFLPSEWNFEKVAEDCFKKFGVRPQEYLIEELYGGKHISSVSNIIFSNGLLDPWASGGVLKDVSKSAIAVIIPEGAHHLDLRFSNPLDPSSVRTARYFYKEKFRKWIKQYRGKKKQDQIRTENDRVVSQEAASL